MNGNTISNLAPGVAAGDAVTVGQVSTIVTTQVNTQVASQINTQLGTRLVDLETKMSAGIAATAALAAIPEPAPGKQGTIGVGVSKYNGEAAVAVGGLYRNLAGTVTFKAGVGYAGKKPVASAGLGFSF